MPIQANWMMFVEFARNIPTLLVCLAAYIICRTRWKQAPQAALFCLLGFGVIAFNAVFGVIFYGLVLNLHLLDGSSFPLAMNVFGYVRMFINATGLVLLLMAVFKDRQSKIETSPFENKEVV